MWETEMELKEKIQEKPRRMAKTLDQNTIGILALGKPVMPYQPGNLAVGWVRIERG